MTRVTLARGLLYVIAVGAIAILANVVLELRAATDRQFQTDVRTEALGFVQDVRGSVEKLIDQVQSVGALFESSHVIDEQEFSRFILRSRFLEGIGTARAFAVMPILAPWELPLFQKNLDARITQRRALGYEPIKIEPLSDRRLYAPAIYVESIEDRAGILGFDIASSPDRLSTGLAALSSSQPHLTKPVALSQDIAKNRDRMSVLIIGAVKSGGDLGLRSYKAIDEDRSIFIAASFTPGVTIEAMLQRLPGGRRFWLTIDDVTDPNPTRLFATDPGLTATSAFEPASIVLGNRVWSFSFGILPVVESGRPHDLIVMFGGFGALLIGALTFALDRLSRARGSLEREVRERTEELHAVNIALADAARKANADNDAKSEFLARMSHDLRTPLNAVIGYAQMMSSEMHGKISQPEYLDYAKTIEKAGRIQLDLVEEVLTLSALTSGTRKFDLARLDLRTIADQCLDIVRLTAANRGINLELNDNYDGTPVFGDVPSIQQIILNLLSNALKFTPAGGTVTIRLENVGTAGYSIAVIDTGVGIAPENIAKVLQPFSKLNENPYVVNEGVGLGLTIVKNLAESNGGEITIESDLGRGTAVIVTFRSAANPPGVAR